MNRENNKLELYINYVLLCIILEDWKFLFIVDEELLKILGEKDSKKLVYYKVKFGDNLIEKVKKVKDEL